MEVDTLYLLIEDLMSYERFMDEIKKKEKEYGGLLNEEAIAYMIVDELGRNLGNKMKIADLYDGINATIEAKVKRIGPVETRKNGELRVMRVDIYDDTGSCQLVLWNEEIDKIGMQLKPEMKIKIINGYVRENIYGLQVSLGKWGIIVFQ